MKFTKKETSMLKDIMSYVVSESMKHPNPSGNLTWVEVPFTPEEMQLSRSLLERFRQAFLDKDFAL